MIWHPLTWAFWAAALSGVGIYGLAALRAVDVLQGWRPERTDADQLRRERHAQRAALLARWSLACLTAAVVLGLAGIAVFWHRIVPGAMCGTGVLQAMGIPGSRALLFWGFSLIVLYAWQVLDQLNRHDPRGLLTRTAARALVGAAPFLFLAVAYAWQALVRVEPLPAVSCCAMAYDQVLHDASRSAVSRWLAPAALWTGLAAGGGMMLLAVSKSRFPDRGSGVMPAAAALLWVIASSIAVKHVWSAYYYQVISHPCPWCLFLPDYGGAGCVIYGTMAVAVLESIALWLADRTRRQHPPLAEAAADRVRRAARRMVWALIGFSLLTAGPAIFWRLRTGVWLGG